MITNTNPMQLMRSNDAGLTWSAATLPPYSLAKGPMVLPNHSERLMIVMFDYGNSAWTPNYLSLDAGMTWQPMTVTSEAIGFSYVDPNEMYVTEGNAFKVSTDSGKSWEAVGTIPEDCVCTTGSTYDCNGYRSQQIEPAPSAPSIIVMRMDAGNGGDSKLCRSADRGAHWAYVSAPFQRVWSIAFDPKNHNTMYAAAPGGGWKTTNGGVSWFPMANGLTEPQSFLIDPENTQVVYALNEQTVWESTDGGAAWQKLDAGIPGLQVINLALVKRQNPHLFAQIWPAGLWELDRTSVLPYSASINAGALFTASPQVTLTLSAPAGTSEMQISNDGGFAGAAWEPFATQRSWTITSASETPMPRTVYVRYRTNGQVSGLYLDDIVLDRTPPTGSVHITDPLIATDVQPASVERIDAADYTLGLPTLLVRHLAGMRTVMLDLTAADTISGVATMRISNHSDFSGAQTLAFAANAEWYIPEHGSATVFVRFIDRAGNISTPQSATTQTP